MDERARLIDILRERSCRSGRFTLASGRESDFYVDVRQTALNAEGSYLLGRLLLPALAPDIAGVGGPTMGADPLVTAITVSSWAAGRPVHGFLIRKHPKGHGTQRYIEGRSSLPDGSRVCIIEDTTTTGGSLITAVGRARAEGLEVVQAIVVVDRQEGAAERVAAETGLSLDALFTRGELLP